MHAPAADEAVPPRSIEEKSIMALGRLWSRIVGLRGWNKEVAMLHNVEGDETPAPGATETTIAGERRPGDLPPDEQHRKYEEWPGEDPGH
jgi:hypothetical protein